MPKIPTLLSGLQHSKFSVRTDSNKIYDYKHSPSGRYFYLFCGVRKLLKKIIVLDTWNETKITLYPLESFEEIPQTDDLYPFFGDDYTIVLFKKYIMPIGIYGYAIKADLETRTFEAKSLSVPSAVTFDDQTIPVAIESEWLLFVSSTADLNFRVFCLNMNTLLIEQYKSISLPFNLFWRSFYYKDHKLYVHITNEKKMICYDLTEHLPWSSKFQEQVPTHEITKVRDQKRGETTGQLEKRDKKIFYNDDQMIVRMMELETGKCRAFKIPWYIKFNFGCRRFPYFAFDGNILTIHLHKIPSYISSKKQLKMRSRRFALRKPESLFNLVWFQRPRDISVPKAMKQRGF